MKARWDCGVCGAARKPGSACRPCSSRRNAEYKARNAQRVTAARAEYKKKKWEQGAAARAEKKLAKAATLAQRRQEAKRRWKVANVGAVNAATARRHAAKMHATPKWADREKTKALYVLAAIYSDALGEPFHVDHIVPLRSRFVCGLHVHDNLQVLPAAENIRKSNRHWPTTT